MKILVLEGSPHKKGSSNTLAEQFIKGAEEVGHNVKVLDVAHMNIHPCQGCDACGMRGSCVQNDDMQIVEQKMRSADMVAFVSPIYFILFCIITYFSHNYNPYPILSIHR